MGRFAALSGALVVAISAIVNAKDLVEIFQGVTGWLEGFGLTPPLAAAMVVIALLSAITVIAVIVLLAKLPSDDGTRAADGVPVQLRAQYLKIMRKEIAGRLSASLESIVLEIAADDQREAVRPNWFVASTQAGETFVDFASAYERYEGRVLLLGDPGSGKSTAILQLAATLVERAIADPSQPLPLLLNLSQLPPAASASVTARFGLLRGRNAGQAADWDAVDRICQIVSRAPVRGLDVKAVRHWIEGLDGNVVFLLDGLDEVDEAERVDLARRLNRTLLDEYPHTPTVIASRRIEYTTVQRDQDGRLHLDGAVMLQPLTDPQIDQYLEAAGAQTLREMLPEDDSLRELARSPLTLSLMVIAYAGVTKADLSDRLDVPERRRQLFDLYVDRMMQREAWHRAGIDWDAGAIAAGTPPPVPPTYSRAEVNRYLGWLARALGAVSRTRFAPNRLTALFEPTVQSVKRADLPQADHFNAAQAMLALLCAAMASVPLFLQCETTWARWLIVVAVLTATLPAVSEIGLLNKPGRWPAGIRALIFLFWLVGLGFSSTIGMAWLAHVGGAMAQTPAEVIGPLLVVALFVYIAFHDTFGRWTGLMILLGLVIVGGTARGIADTINPSVVWLILTIPGAVLVFRKEQGARASLIIFTALFALLGWGAQWLSFSLVSLGLAFFVAVWSNMLISFGDEPVPALGWSIAMTAGGLAYGAEGSIAALYCGSFLIQNIYGRPFLKRIYDPFLALIVRSARSVPWRFDRFLRYAQSALLIRRVGGEYEFFHLLLRNHFACRDLIPRLAAAPAAEKIELIEALVRQGDAGFDAIRHMAMAGEVEVRRAATTALCRIPARGVAGALRHILATDPDPKVRAAAICDVSNISNDDALDLLSRGLADSEPLVHQSVARTLKRSGTELFRSESELANGIMQNLWRHSEPEILEAAIILNPRDSAGRASNDPRLFALADRMLRQKYTGDDHDEQDAGISFFVFHDDGLPHLIAALNDLPAESQANIVRFLAHIPDERVISAIQRVFRSNSPRLGILGDWLDNHFGFGSNQCRRACTRALKKLSAEPWL